MFFDALPFNQNIGGWNVARVSNMYQVKKCTFTCAAQSRGP